MVNNDIKILVDHIQLLKLSKVKFSKSKEVIEKIKNVTIRSTKTRKYFVYVTCKL